MSKLNWIDIWKKIIKASQIALRDGDDSKFKKLEAEFPEDAMLHLEKAIFWEIQEKYDDAKNEYERAIELDTVPQWIRATEFFLKRCIDKKSGHDYSPYDPYDSEDESTWSIPENDRYNVQWTAFYNLHSYVYLSNHVRCLSLSVIDRIDSLPEIAAIVFRLCMEKTLKKIFPSEFKDTDFMRDEDLCTAIEKLYKSGKINSKQRSYCDHIRDVGNKAVHKGLDDWKDSDIIKLVSKYDKLMCFLNNLCKERSSV